MLPTTDRAGDAALGVTVVTWAFAFPAISAALDGYSPWPLALLRLGTAAVVLGLVAVRLRPALPRGRDVVRIVLVGLIGQSLYQGLLMFGQTAVAAGTASLIIATAPLASVLAARALLGEPIGRRWAGMLVAFAGAAIVGLSKGFEGRTAALAVVAVAAAALCQGAYHVLVKPVAERLGAFAATFWNVLAGALLCLPALPLLMREAAAAPVGATVSGVLLGVVPSAIGYLAWSFAVSRTSVARSTVALYLVAPIAILMAWAWLGQVPNPIAIVGGAVAIAGVAMVRRVRAVPEIAEAGGARR